MGDPGALWFGLLGARKAEAQVEGGVPFPPREGAASAPTPGAPHILYGEGPPFQRLPEEGSRPTFLPRSEWQRGVRAAPKVQVSCPLAGGATCRPAGELQGTDTSPPPQLWGGWRGWGGRGPAPLGNLGSMGSPFPQDCGEGGVPPPWHCGDGGVPCPRSVPDTSRAD